MINHELHLVEGVSYLKQLRQSMHMSQEEMARLIGVSSKTVYRWEAGVHTVNLTSLQWKNLYKEILVPLNINILDLPDDLGAPYVKTA